MKESHITEFKETWRDEYLKCICGFANAEGGTLIIGKNDKGVPVGLANAVRLLEELPNKIRDVLGVMADVRLLQQAGKDLVEIRVPPYPSPISCRGEYYYRSGSTKQELKGAALDHLCIWNPGVLPETWTVRKLFTQHSSCPYNPLIANAFFRAGEIEAWGRGMQRILDACNAAGTPRPRITYDPSDLWFEFPFAPEYLRIIAAPVQPAGIPSNISADSKEKSKEKSREKNSDRLLALMRQQATVTTQQLAATLGLSRAGVEKIIRGLKKAGALRRVGPDKGGHWEVRQ